MLPRAVPLTLLALALTLFLPTTHAQGWQLTGSQRVVDMAVGNGRILTVGGVQGGIRSSADGIAWTTLSTTKCRAVCYGNGQFWIVTEADELLRTNGNATPVKVADDFLALDMAYGDGRLVAVCQGDMAGFYFSEDEGLTWERSLCPVEFDPEVGRIVFANGRFVATAAFNLMSSADGKLWEAPVRFHGGLSQWEPWTIGHGPDGFLVLDFRRGSETGITYHYYCWRSQDGIEWSYTLNKIKEMPWDLHFMDGKFYGAYGNKVASSANGIDWTEENTGTALYFDQIDSLNGTLFAGGSQVIRKLPAAPSNAPPPVLAIRPAIELSFMGQDSAEYRIEGSANLQDWQSLESGIIGHGAPIRRLYSTENQPHRYFRLVTP